MARGQNVNSLVFNKPLLITLDALQPITDYLSSPERSANLKLSKPDDVVDLKLEDFNNDQDYRSYKLKRLGINPETMVGLVDISGTLVYRKGQMNANCMELVSYEGLKEQVEMQINEGVKSIVFKIDSGGGAALGMESAAKYIKKITKQNGVKTVSYVDGSACSAAYGLAVMADEIVSHPMGQVGSVGVVVALYNDSKMLDNMGVKRQFVFAGDNKIPFDNSTGEFTDKFISDLQKSVDKTYKSFVNHIATNRGLSQEAVINTQASVFDVDEAMSLGFIDKIMELEDFEVSYGLKVQKSNVTGYGQNLELPVENKQLKSEDTQKGEKLMTMENPNVDAQDKTLQEQLTTLTEQLNTAESEKQKLNSQVLALQEKETNLKTQLASALADKAKAELDLDTFKKTTEMNARVERLAAVFGSESEKVALYSEAFKDLPQSAFDAFVGEFEASLEKQDKEMEEKGHNAPVDTVSTVDSLKQAAEQRAAKRK